MTPPSENDNDDMIPGQGEARPSRTGRRRSDPTLRLVFATRLNDLLRRRGWQQADLVRASGVPRDAISTYVRGDVVPGPANLERLAHAFDVKPSDLLPSAAGTLANMPASRVSTDNVATMPGYMHLQVNQIVRTGSAIKILAILEEEHAAYAEGSGGNT